MMKKFYLHGVSRLEYFFSKYIQPYLIIIV